MALLIYLLLGAVVGTLAGLLGIGGGLIIVPALVFSFTAQGMSPLVLTHLAIGTSLATIVVTSLSSAYQHHRLGAIDWHLFWPLAAGISLGAVLGVQTAVSLTGNSLQLAIGIFAALAALKMAFNIEPPASKTPLQLKLLLPAGGFIGWVSTLFGIGGGVITVPLLTWQRLAIQRAVALSAACGVPIACFGTVTNIWAGWQNPELPPWSFGFIYLPALLGIVITSAFFARFGVRLAHRLPAAKLRKIFALLLFLVAVRFLTNAL